MNGAYPPGPRGLPILGSAGRIASPANILPFFQENVEQYGDIFFFKAFGVPIYFINHPDYVQQVLVTDAEKYYRDRLTKRVGKKFVGEGILFSEGSFHHTQRRYMQPAFHHQHLATYVDDIGRITREWLSETGDHQVVDVHRRMMRLTLSVICEVLFKADIQEGQMRQQLEQAMDYFHEVMGVEVRSTIPIPDWTPIPRKRRLRASVSALNKIVNDLVVERRAAEDADGSMLTMLLSLKNDAGEPAMSDKQITDECITIFMAGHETSALVLTWACYLLAKYPDVQDRIRAEVDAVLGDRQPTLADLSQLTYTTMVLKETMRMYPPGWILGREAVEPAKIGDYDIAVGSLIFISPYLFHRDERFFEDAQTFKPERFDPAVEKQIQKYTFLPFSAGPRVCMGAGFAMMEMPIALATIVQQFCVETTSSEEIEILPALTLMPASPVNIRFHKRQ